MKLILRAFAVSGVVFIAAAIMLFLWRGDGAQLIELRTFLIFYFLCAVSALFWALARVIALLERRA
ncbi:MAG: hypothetical protein AAFN79_06630 [Pseudomonadota bacterium]